MNKQYHLSIRYFLLMTFMLLVTGVWLLLLHSSLNLESFTNYYVQKSLFGLLEVTSPHLFAMGTVIFILTHFLALDKQNRPLEHKVTLMLFGLMLLSNLSGFFITKATPWLIWIKLGVTSLFLLLLLFLIVRIFFFKNRH